MANEAHWYQLKVRPGFEMVVAQRLRRQGVEVIDPNPTRDIPRKIEARDHRGLLSPGHVFCRFALEDQQSILSTPGVLCIAGSPAPTAFDGCLVLQMAATDNRE